MWLAGFAQDEKPISQELRELDEASSKKVPASLLEAGRKGAEEIRASGILEKALNKGAKMPEFTLSDALNKPVKSKDLLRQGHLIIVFYRGAW
jgi:hypothetical protein